MLLTAVLVLKDTLFSSTAVQPCNRLSFMFQRIVINVAWCSCFFLYNKPYGISSLGSLCLKVPLWVWDWSWGYVFGQSTVFGLFPVWLELFPLQVLAMSSRSWLSYSYQSRFHLTPLSYETLEFASGFASEQCPEGIVAISTNTLRWENQWKRQCRKPFCEGLSL